MANNPTDASYTFLPWVRQGLISAVQAKPTTARAQIDVTTQIKNNGGAGATSKVNILLFGPGDVTGLDGRQVIRTIPPNLTPDFEPNYMPVVEIDDPGVPWFFTHDVPDGQNHLQPWICLIVIEKREGVVKLEYAQGDQLAVLTIKSGAQAELPDLSEAWAWAHVQVSGELSSEDDLQKVLESQPKRNLSRLICPRHLKPNTAYYACIVPTFKGGRQAGLGEPVDRDEHALDLAWTIGSGTDPDAIRLPVYYHWEFATGAQGDFESLVWQLERRQLTLNEVGTRKLDVSKAGYGLPITDNAVDLEGALMPPLGEDDELVGPSSNYQSRLQSLVNETAASSIPVLPPPIYGRWHAAQRAIPDVVSSTLTRDRPWLRAINLDPRYRVAAGLGAQVVREQQEQLVASAWEQLGDIERANQMIRQAQLARAASTFIYQNRFGLLDATSFLLVTGPVQSRVSYTTSTDNQERTARGQVQASALPLVVTGAQFRRIVRPRSKVADRFGITSTEIRNQVISHLNQRQIRPAPLHWRTPNGMVTIESLINQSPCNTKPETFVQWLLEKWPPDKLLEILDTTLEFLTNTHTQEQIANLPEKVSGQLGQVNEGFIAAKGRLNKYVKTPASTDESDLDRVIGLYGRAWSFIARARQIIVYLLAFYGGSTLPDVIAQLDQDTHELPASDDLRLISFGLAATTHEQSVEPCDDEPVKLNPPLNIDELKTYVYEKLDPNTTIPAHIGTLIEAPGWKADELELIMAGPDFPTPMYALLAKVGGQDYLLPGLERVPPNTITLLEANTKFIEAFEVGLNHVWAGEALWRGLPFELRFTSFRQFFDPAGRFPPPADEKQRQENLEKGKDIPPIHEWRDEELGKSFGKASAQSGASSATQPMIRPIVLLIRGELLRRYPRANIFMVTAKWDQNEKLRNPDTVTDDNDPTQVLHPLFRGELSPDINFLGFQIAATDAVGEEDMAANKPGWFIVIEQQATEPRFGLDETIAKSGGESTWRDLSWEHLNLPRENSHIKDVYVSLAKGLSSDSAFLFPDTAKHGPDSNDKWRWESPTDSAQLACITLQEPVRVYIHASDLLQVPES